jgi:hypothetical protein
MASSFKKVTLSFAIAICIAFVAFAVYYVVIIPMNVPTKTHMMIIEGELLNFNHKYHRLPVSLDELMATNGDSINTLDAWGHPIQYLPQTNGVVLLKNVRGNIELSFSITN